MNTTLRLPMLVLAEDLWERPLPRHDEPQLARVDLALSVPNRAPPPRGPVGEPSNRPA